MKVSVVTVCYNAEKFIRTCIESVVSQTYPDIEYIIIDALSKDATMQIVRAYGDKITKVVSEKDKGIYDGMNKGVKLATGDIVAILNADDIFYDSQVIEKVVDAFRKQPQTDILYSDIVYIKDDNLDKVVRYYSPKNFKLKDLEYGLIPPHPGVFVRRKCYEKFGYFSLDYRICGDFELMLRLLYVNKVAAAYLPLIATKMRTGGSSSMGFKTTMRVNAERMRACKANGVPTNYLKLYSKYIEKFFQLFKRPQQP